MERERVEPNRTHVIAARQHLVGVDDAVSTVMFRKIGST